jgi:hypothetical protein
MNDIHDFRSYRCETIKGYVLLFDEAQCLLPVKNDGYVDSRGNYTRSLFCYLVHLVSSVLSVPSFCCGTQLRLKDVDGVSSAAGGGKQSVRLFTQFHFYTFSEIKSIFEKSMGPDTDKFAELDSDSVTKACYYLQGRPRFFTTFWSSLCQDSTRSFSKTLESYLRLITMSGEPMVSLKYFWERVLKYDTKLHSLDDSKSKKTPDHYCFDLLSKYLLSESDSASSQIVLSASDADLISTALISLREVRDGFATYFLMEPMALEAAFELMKTNSDMEKKFMKYLIEPIAGPVLPSTLPADARGKLLDKFIAFRSRMG